MGRVIAAAATILVASAALAQEPTGYAPGENPFQAEYAFGLGRPIQLRVEVLGVRFDAVTLSALDEVKPGAKVKCETLFTGTNAGDKKATLTMVLLLEDADGHNLERLTLDSFKVKAGKPYEERQKTQVSGDALAATAKVYVFVRVDT
ncbi:MAG TPA: hypothetical protein VLW17_01705 [Thermoanaerobaculaceae bacterium]|nr:hypothetical protein [Thermoanaerobaculaceae bacterium]